MDFFYNILEMSLVVKATTTAFQYNNYINLSSEDIIKFSNHDKEIGSKMELKNNFCKKFPNPII